MKYTLEISNSAKKDFHSFDGLTKKRIIEVIDALSVDPRPFGYIKLKGFKNLLRVRVGNYRIIYSVNDTERIVIIKKTILSK